MQSLSPPVYSIPFPDQIYCFEICKNDFAHNLACVVADKKLILGTVNFPEESEAQSFAWEHLKDIYHESRCHVLSFAPSTSLLMVPKTACICAAGADFVLRVFRTDLQNSDTIQLLKGHINYINEVAWDNQGNYLASVSDDHSCKIWSTESNLDNTITFCLRSAGMSVKWHPEEPCKVLVAEKRGLIHIYNVRSHQEIMSIESPKCPLMSADWALSNRLFIAALAGGSIITWDLRKPCSPSDIKLIHEDFGRIVRFSPTSDVLLSSIGRPDTTLKVSTAKSVVPLIEAPLKLYSGMAWHYRLPYVAAAYDRILCFWKIKV